MEGGGGERREEGRGRREGGGGRRVEEGVWRELKQLRKVRG